MQSLAASAYAKYLLVAYGVTALVVIGNIVTARRRFSRTRRRLGEQVARRAANRQASGPANRATEERDS